MGPSVSTSDTFEEFVFMGKKKDKATESKNDKAPKSKAESFLDNLRPTTTGKPENTRGTGSSKIEKSKTSGLNDKTKKVIAGGIVAVALGALTLVGLNMTGPADDAAVQSAPAAAVTQQQPARAASEAAAASMLPQPLAPQKARLAEPTKKQSELAKPSKTSKTSKKSGKLASKTKSKDSVKKSVASSKKQKATKKSKKTLAAKSID
jgi:hypothetical protein